MSQKTVKKIGVEVKPNVWNVRRANALPPTFKDVRLCSRLSMRELKVHYLSGSRLKYVRILDSHYHRPSNALKNAAQRITNIIETRDGGWSVYRYRLEL